MVAAEEHGRDLPPPVLGRARVLRVLEEAIGERFVFGRSLVAKGARDVPRDGVDDDHGRQFAAREDVVADRYLEVYAMLDEARVHPFVTAADEDEARLASECAREGVGEAHALRREVDDEAGFGCVRARGLERGIEDVDAHDHPLAATEGVVIDGAMAVAGGLADIVQVEVEEAGFARAPEDGDIERAGEGGREEGEDIDAHSGIVRPGRGGGHTGRPGW